MKKFTTNILIALIFMISFSGMAQYGPSDDFDGDGIINSLDLDDDNDGLLDSDETTCNNSSSGVFIALSQQWQNTNLAIVAGQSYKINLNGSTLGLVTAAGGPNSGKQFYPISFGTNGVGDYEGNLYNLPPGGNVATFYSNPEPPANLPFANLTAADYSNIITFVGMIDTNGNGQYNPGIDVLIPNILDMSEGATGGVQFIAPQSGNFYIVFTDNAYGDNSGNIAYNMQICGVSKDTDGDTIPDSFDTDSDGDGCADAIESSEYINVTQIHSLTLPVGDPNYAFRGQIKVLANGTTQGTPAQVVSTLPAANGVPMLVNPASANNGSVAGAADNTDNTSEIGNTQVYGLDATVNLCVDTDNDGIADAFDRDIDNDGILNDDECSYSFDSDQFTMTAPFTQATNCSTPMWLQNAPLYYIGLPSNDCVRSPFPGQQMTDHTTGSTTSGSVIGIQAGPGNDFITAVTIQGNVIPNSAYTLNFAHIIWERIGSSIADNQGAIQVFVNGILQTTIYGTANLPFNIWETSTIPFNTGSNNNITLEIKVRRGASVNGNDYLLDDIRLSTTSLLCDYDGDGTPNIYDLDSDNDGCPDAMEGDENVNTVQLNPNGSINVTTYGGVNSMGVPNLVNAGGAADSGSDQGQGHGFSSNSVVDGCFCLKPSVTSGAALATPLGITSLGRAGSNASEWPTTRKGAWIALESKSTGFVPNRLTTAQKNALVAVEGMIIYDTDLDCISIYDGTLWKCMTQQGCPAN